MWEEFASEPKQHKVYFIGLFISHLHTWEFLCVSHQSNMKNVFRFGDSKCRPTVFFLEKSKHLKTLSLDTEIQSKGYSINLVLELK